MFPISIHSSIIIDAPQTKLEGVLNAFGDALRSAGVTRIDRSPCRLEFQNPYMVLFSYKLFAMISSGAIWLDSSRDRVTVNYRMKTMKILGAFLPVAILSYGIAEAGNLTTFSKAMLIVVFLMLFLGGNYVITSIRIHRWAIETLQSCGTEKE